MIVGPKFHFAQSETFYVSIFCILKMDVQEIPLMICWVCNNLLNRWAETSRIVLDPNEVEAFGHNGTSRLTNALDPSSRHLWFLPGLEEVLHKTVGQGCR